MPADRVARVDRSEREADVLFRGAVHGAIAFVLAAALAAASAPSLRTVRGWALIAGNTRSVARSRLIALCGVAALAGLTASVAAGAHVSGTAPIGVSAGFLLVAGASAMGWGHDPWADAPVAPDAPPDPWLWIEPISGFPGADVVIELTCGALVILTGCLAAWLADLRGRSIRPGDPGRDREIITGGVPALVVVAVVPLVVVTVWARVIGPGRLAGPVWLAACAGAAHQARSQLHVRSSIFLWPAPALAVVVYILDTMPGGMSPTLWDVLHRSGVPLAAVAPAGALAACLGYRLALRDGRAESRLDAAPSLGETYGRGRPPARD